MNDKLELKEVSFKQQNIDMMKLTKLVDQKGPQPILQLRFKDNETK